MAIIGPAEHNVADQIRKKFVAPCSYGNRKYAAHHYGAGDKIHGVWRIRSINGKQIQIRQKLYEPSDQSQPDKVARQIIFADAVLAWQNLTDSQENVYNKRVEFRKLSGYNLFISEYLLSH